MFKKTLFFLLAVCAAVLGFVIFSNPKQRLISPFAGVYDDHSDLVNKNISTPQTLDFQFTKTLPVLETLPRYLVYNTNTGKVYFSKNEAQVFSPASFTKLLTAQVALDLATPETEITATPDSVNKIPTVLGIKPGEVFKVKDLLRGAIATSANDAAQTLADGAAKHQNLSPKNFVELMNSKSKLLGLTQSHFANPDGLDDPKQFATLKDIAKIIRNVQNNYPEILAAGKSDMEDIASSSAHGHYYLPNWNGLLGIYPGVDGLKIAYTEGAGYSTIVTFNQPNLKLVAIVSGADSLIERDMAAAALLDAALIEEHISPKNITKTQINRHYKVWGDLARKIKKEISDSNSNQ